MPTNVELIKNIPLFSTFHEDDLASLASLLVERDFQKGEKVFFEGDPGDALYIVRSGFVKIYLIAEDGREKTLALFGPGEFFGEMSLLDGQPRSAIAEAWDRTEVFVLYRKDFYEMIRANPETSENLIKVLASRLRKANADVMDVVFLDVRGRIGRTLINLTRHYGDQTEDGVKIGVKITHKELANIVGTARETVTRVLTEFQDEGLLTFEGRYMVIVDMAQLEQTVTL